MTRAEADELVSVLEEYVDERTVYLAARRTSRVVGGAWAERDERNAFNVMNAARERLIDRLCGEEATQPLAGRAT